VVLTKEYPANHWIVILIRLENENDQHFSDFVPMHAFLLLKFKIFWGIDFFENQLKHYDSWWKIVSFMDLEECL